MNQPGSAIKPPWIRFKIPGGEVYREVRGLLKRLDLATVCEEARCPNVTECWNRRSATIMILGRTCTRSCRFCAVKSGDPGGRIDPGEPERVAEAVGALGLRYLVITSVDRDDLPDQGSGHYAATVARIKRLDPGIRVEALIPDFSGSAQSIRSVLDAGPDVVGHNLETVRRLTPMIRDRRSGYGLSLDVLAVIRERSPQILAKSGFMVGLGETGDEIVQTLRDLAAARVDIVTIGQYLQPSRNREPVLRYYRPEEFEGFRRIGLELGIPLVLSGPLVRSSYRAAESWNEIRETQGA